VEKKYAHNKVILTLRTESNKFLCFNCYTIQDVPVPFVASFETFDPPSTFPVRLDAEVFTAHALTSSWSSQSQSYLTTVRRPLCHGVRPQLGPVTNFSFFFKFSLDSCGFVILWCPLWREDGYAIYCCCLASPALSPSGLSHAG
jgi:hypothetical protein